MAPHSASRFAVPLLLGLLLAGATHGAPPPPADPSPARTDLRAHGVESMVYATRELFPDGHWYANLGYYAPEGEEPVYRAGGRLIRLDLKSGETKLLVDDPAGSVRDPAVHYDGKTIVFSWRRAGTKQFHLYEIQSDGSGLRQITDGEFDDIEPCWLPDDRLVFVSTRCRRWVNCWLTHVTTMYRCNRDGSDLRPISYNTEHDNTPWVLNDGRLLYMRWEYVDRSQVHYHHLWTSNPDGTAVNIFYGNQAPGDVYLDAKPIPGSRDVVMIRSPGHGANDHQGLVALVTPTRGPDAPGAVRDLNPAAQFRDPYPVTADLFLAARFTSIVLMDRKGQTRPVVDLPPAYGQAWAHEPRPLVPRPREPLIADRVQPKSPTGRMMLTDVYAGRNMSGVARGDIKKLLVLEVLPKPINYTGGMEPLSLGGTFTLERVVGTVPVEEDGSACFELPAGRAFFFVALDARDRSVKRMQSLTGVMPGETIGCIGCHEPRTEAPPGLLANASDRRRLPAALALRKPPATPVPIAGVPDVYDFPRDIQPILNRLCLDCHDYTPTARGGPRSGGVILSGDHGPLYSHSYATMTFRGLFSDGRNLPKSNYPPRKLGSSASRILDMVADGRHHGVKATEREQTLLRLWIETGAPYPGTYAALGCGMIGGFQHNKCVLENVSEAPEAHAAWAAIRRRCDSCHTGEDVLAHGLCDGAPKARYDRHLDFNLTRPEQSLALLAPLAKAAGGYGLCRAKDVKEGEGRVFASKDDPDYKILLTMIEAGRNRLNTITRFDMPNFKPRPAYLREMKRYGVLPPDFDPTRTPVNVYDLDRAYWRTVSWFPDATSVGPAVPLEPSD